MVITEIFKSIQGEGTRAGLPCLFVRLTGCNLRCHWCDTAYAFYGGTKMDVDAVLSKVKELSGCAESPGPTGTNGHATGVHLVEITGGEPLLQPEVYPLIDRLLAAGFDVMVETSGERFVGKLPREVIKIVDVKCPDSGEADSFDPANLDAVDEKDEMKFVISTRRDYEFAREFTTRHRLAERVRQVIFSPVMADPEGKWPAMNARDLAKWILADGLPVRLGMQLHKFIWDPAARGV